MTFAILLLVGGLGALGNWYVNRIQLKTSSTLIEYVAGYGRRTVASLSSIAGGILVIYESSPELTPLTLVSSYLVGYALDSTLNKDAGAATISVKN